ncbi:MAG: hypothetical protein WBV28_16835 [Terracidiphilus sp.]
MKNRLTAVMLGSLAMVSAATVQAQLPNTAAEFALASPPADMPALPPLPRGKTTIFGGELRSIDPVLDQLTLNVYGARPMRMLFDERTQAYRDGKRVPLRDLGAAEHASIETTLDGTKVFAVSIHILSHVPEGDYEGRILSYNPITGELTLASGQSPEPFKLFVQRTTSIIRKGQSTFTSTLSGSNDLQKGTLVSALFAADGKQEASASRIEILAVPGTSFVFSGNVTSIDLHSGLLILVDARDQQDHQIFMNATNLPTAQNIHMGDDVRVVATYDGTRYVANEVSMTKH